MTNNAEKNAASKAEQKRVLLAKLIKEKKNNSRVLPTSFAQRRLWFLDQMVPDSAFYNITFAFELHGDLKIEALNSAFSQLVKRHQTLRTTFTIQNDEPVQVIHPPSDFNITIADLTTSTKNEQDNETKHLLAKESHQAFDLKSGPLFRVKLIKLDVDKHLLVLAIHHIITDGWSNGILMRELSELYRAKLVGEVADLPELEIQYADFAIWQRKRMRGDVLATQLDYWKKQLENNVPLELPTDRLRPAVQTFNGALRHETLAVELTSQLRHFCQSRSVSLYMTMLACFNLLLQRYTSQDDISVGSPVANRNRAELENLIGCFVNSLVIRTDLSGDPDFLTMLEKVKETTLAAFEHQDIPFEKLVEELLPERNPSISPLFQVMFTVQNIPTTEFELPGLSFRVPHMEIQSVKFDMDVYVWEQNDTLLLRFIYNTDLFDETTIVSMMGHYQQLLSEVLAEPSKLLSKYRMLSSAEHKKIIHQWNLTSSDYPMDKTVHELFEAQVVATPNSVAVVEGGNEITYRQLNQRANRLANKLTTEGVKAGDLVGVSLERDISLIVSLLGILKSGGAYVPLDPAYPQDRLAFIIDDAQIQVMVTESQLKDSLPANKTFVLLDDKQLHDYSDTLELELQDVSTESLAYVIYTSGSIGKPKGVKVPHRSVVNFLSAMAQQPGITVKDSLLAVTTVSFDIHVLELFLPLTAGARIVLADKEDVTDGYRLLSLLRSSSVSIMQATPATWRMLIEAGWNERLGLKVLCGGEALPLDLSRQLLERCDELWNMYGPTETTVWSSVYQVQANDTAILVGHPIQNTQFYIVDQEHRPVPEGVTGELYIGGLGVTKGYVNRPELTQTHFVKNFIDPDSEGLLYKTGDLARYKSDGNVQMLGRSDHQVKLRGFRIELGEIETVLSEMPEVSEAVVMVREDIEGDLRLVAYAIANAQSQPSLTAVKAFLKESLPEYMIPVNLVWLEEFPLTANEKIDRKALPAPDAPASVVEFIAPCSDMEKRLAAIWQDVLHIEQVGMQDNFFELGGHSLLATRVVSRIRKEFGRNLALSKLFTSPILSDLVLELSEMKSDNTSAEIKSIVPVNRNTDLPLSYGQERLWFLDQLEEEGLAAYNIPIAIHLQGELDIHALESSLTEIVQRHEILRSYFEERNGELVQAEDSGFEFNLEKESHPDLSENEFEQKIQQEALLSFDLSHSGLFRGTLLKLSSSHHVLLLTLHHIISDAWSLGVLFKELSVLYAAYNEDKSSTLPELPIQYVDFAVWQREFLSGEVFDSQLAYWSRQLDNLTTLELPADKPRSVVQTFAGDSKTLVLDGELKSQLDTLCKREGVTLFIATLSMFTLLLHRYTGQNDIVVGTPIANRNRYELEGLIGLFVNMLVMRVDVTDESDFSEFLRTVKKMVLDAYEHQDIPFEKLVEEIDPVRDQNRNPLFQVMFTSQNAAIEPVELKGLTLSSAKQKTYSTHFDLECHIAESDTSLALTFVYNTDLFNVSTIQQMLEHYRNILMDVVAHPEASIKDIQLLSQADRQRILLDWNNTAAAYPKGDCLHQLFEQQVNRSPEAVAVFSGKEQISYRELNQRANQLANRLKAESVKAGDLVGVSLERDISLIVSLLGILKSGGTYVPLDPTYPEERLAFIIEDARIQVLVTDSQIKNSLPAHKTTVLQVDKQLDNYPDTLEKDIPGISTESLAYVIYTSGSTGKPKGVKVPHRSVVNFLSAMVKQPEITAKDSLLAVTTVSFDIHVLELFLPLIAGARIVLADKEDVTDGYRLLSLLRNSGVTIMQATPATWRMLIEAGWNERLGLKVLCGGEALPLDLSRQLLERCAELWNMYGPTETTVWSSVYRVQEKDTAILVGHPINNTQFYIVDQEHRPVPIGVTGELYIGGSGVTKGYVNRPELTQAYFIENFIDPASEGLLYKTGDLARYKADGNVQILGRSDHQVKLRGFRIELGEIETVLVDMPEVSEAVAIVREDREGDQRLVAYAKANAQSQPSLTEVKAFLKETLPEYMIPSNLVWLNEFPLTPNGKIDRKVLPAPDSERHLKNIIVAAKGKMELAISDIWKSLLNLDEIGVEDNFFDLGGHSLLLVKLHRRLKNDLDAQISMVDLFRYTTIASLARYLGGDEPSDLMTDQIKQRAQRQRENKVDDDAIAVIGMAGQFPGSPDIQSFWQNLINGVESIRFFNDEELSEAGIPEAMLQNPDYVPACGYVDDADLFDANFFGYSPHEAELIDPQHRLFLETSWHALEHAAYDPKTYAGLISVFAGTSMNTYVWNLLTRPELLANIGLEFMISNEKDFLATRVSYKLDLKGPSYTLQTACSTSLVAIHEACRNLRDYDSDIALAGGVSVNVPRVNGYTYQQGSIMSPDGHCRAFDAQANGTVFSEGVGVVVLKRLKDAISDNDTIHAVIKGSAINNDGAEKAGYTAPGIQGQVSVIAMAQASAGVTSDTIDYVETHGTGTSLGDPIEVSALTQAFAQNASKQHAGRSHKDKHCALGAVKSNIGHLDAAAGVAGFIKTVLSLEHAKIPPSLHYTVANPEIDFEHSPFYVNTVAREWLSKTMSPRRAGVSSFGIGGTNAHVILEQAPQVEADVVNNELKGKSMEQLIILSAKTETALETKIKQLADHMQSHADIKLQDIAYTLQLGRSMLEYRCMLVCNQLDTAVESLQTKDPATVLLGNGTVSARNIVFMFSGQGAQYPDMAKDLYLQYDEFRDTVDSCCEILHPHIDINLLDLLYPQADQLERAAQQLMLTQYAQCSLFVIEYATAKLWMQWGVKPSAMIGHSIGEYVAACLSGVITLNDALGLVANRGRLMQAQPAGSMLSVSMPVDELQALIPDELEHTISIATVNAPTLCVVSGEDRDIELLEQLLEQGEHNARRLHTSHAFHSSMMDAVLEPFTQLFDSIQLHAPEIPFVSNLTGEWIKDAEAMDATYWGRHLRNTVLFSDGMKTLMQEGFNCFIEVGPGNTLATFTRQHNRYAEGEGNLTILSSIRHPRESQTDTVFIQNALGRLWLAGHKLDWKVINTLKLAKRIPLPLYPFERKKYWINPALHNANGSVVQTEAKNKNIDDWFYMPAWQCQLSLTDISYSDTVEDDSLKPKDRKIRNWLVFIDKTGLGEKVVSKLIQSGDRIVTVNQGQSYAVETKDKYIVSADEQDYFQLCRDLQKESFVFNDVIYLWAIGGEENNILPELELSFYIPMFMSKALNQFIEQNDNQLQIKTWFISDGIQQVFGDEVIYPIKSTLLGVNSVSSKEMLHLTSCCIDFPVLNLNDHNAEIIQHEYSDYLLSEIWSSANDDNIMHGEIAYRSRFRWIKSFEPLLVNSIGNNSEITKIDHKRLKPQGVYLITGGFGGIGRVFAKYLAENFQARLVLTGRSELPDTEDWDDWLLEHDEFDSISKKIKFVRALEHKGAKVLASCCDTNDETNMKALIDQATLKFGCINGVIHSAGLPGGGLIQLKTKQSAADVMAPKVQGGLILDNLFENNTLDFMLFCSSITAVLGSIGQVDYAAANIFLDSLAKHRQQKGLYTVSVNWDAWSETGMAVNEYKEEQQLALKLGIRSVEGIDVFNRVLNRRYSQAIISTVDLGARITNELNLSLTEETDKLTAEMGKNVSYDRPDISSALVEAETESQQLLVEIWMSLFNIKEIGIHDNFFELGGHSLLAIQAIAIIKEKLGVFITIDKFLELSTVEHIAFYIDALEWGEMDDYDEHMNDNEDRNEFDL